ncbi:MAG: anaerobic ribonucleoside-triphosphate reductase activating protein [Lachnospiraceae bacterium]|nr:anaerobic ribonucleoside-triphosphate reductase activating protein [Lachnospiraceae bacterium]
MRYHNITKDDMLNGDGLRVVLWVSGCSHCCEGCQNPVTWDSEGGLPFDAAAKQEVFDELAKDYISGITFSGGDPLFFKNRPDVTELIREIRETFPDKTIWLYTGYEWETIRDLPMMKQIDVVIDGPFVLSLLDNQLKWRGSSNQRVIDVQKSLQTEDKEAVLYCD